MNEETDELKERTVTTNCLSCGTEFESVTLALCSWRPLWKYCPPCSKIREEENARYKAEQARMEQDRTLAHWIPALYRNSDRSQMSPSLLNLIDDWDLDSTQGLYLSGKIGSRKTRSACMILERYCRAGQSIAMVQSTYLAQLFVSQFKDDEGKDSRDTLKAIKRADALLIDDIGKERCTERYETEIFAILEYRTSNLMPTLYTSNMSLNDLGNKLSKDQGGAILRRIEEFCDLIRI